MWSEGAYIIKGVTMDPIFLKIRGISAAERL